MHYLFAAKPTDHVFMYEWLDAFPELPATEYVDEKGKTHKFYWQNDVPLNGGADAIKVNYLEYQQIDESGKVTFKNSWFTDIEITDSNTQIATYLNWLKRDVADGKSKTSASKL